MNTTVKRALVFCCSAFALGANAQIPSSTFFCTVKGATGFESPHTRSSDFRKERFVARWQPATPDLKSGSLDIKQEELEELYWCVSTHSGKYGPSRYLCDGPRDSVRFNPITLRGIRLSVGEYMEKGKDGGTVAIEIFSCEDFEN